MDESLSPHVAKALRLVGYNMIMAEEVPEFATCTRVLEQDFIPWLAQHNGVWIHSDDNAKREHRKLIHAEGIRTLWVYRPRGKMSSREQLRVLSYVLPDLLGRFSEKPRQRHYQVYVHGSPPRTRVKLQPLIL